MLRGCLLPFQFIFLLFNFFSSFFLMQMDRIPDCPLVLRKLFLVVALLLTFWRLPGRVIESLHRVTSLWHLVKGFNLNEIREDLLGDLQELGNCFGTCPFLDYFSDCLMKLWVLKSSLALRRLFLDDFWERAWCFAHYFDLQAWLTILFHLNN